MNTLDNYSNAVVWWTEREIAEREALVQQCYHLIRETWFSMNSAVHGCRVETPVLTNISELQGHIDAGFPMLITDRGVLRPETTAGCIAAFHSMFPMSAQRKKRMPFYVWQLGKSFRDEKNPATMRASRLRLIEFHQLEFELFCDPSTKADYLTAALSSLVNRFGGKIVTPSDLPHYSRRTLDWEINDIEVAGCSERTDWAEGIIYEISIGIDRLVALLA